ncbi:hypothetical protein HYH03_006261 [Edaphochlamys debaryana]|uniref:Fe2OG dioxygenase domain-containing protein n=1 Tax=Edaphochlamys debaryana TaxID=47281 RepID=A0A835Y469_9CHLO|nr:hypothetical protein HYH03_006261 [Edaphochlamys debaryana]|eukprot:KAG2495661.1 hypothetical protein HYH03_006261 [Edaphochlamys debaryana]
MHLVRLYLALVVAGALWQLGVGARTGESESEERFIGWKGESYRPDRVDAAAPNGTNDSKRPWIQVVSWKPRAAIYHNFLSDRECKHILDLAKGQMQRSQVVGKETINDIRTSYGTFLRRNYDPVIAAIEQRVSMWSQLPISHQEDLQVLRYGPSHKYGPHLDGLKRAATMLMYLVEPEEGGETTFTNSEWAHPEIGKALDPTFSSCAKGHVAMKPKRGDALLFFDRLPDLQTEDPRTMHTACPVIKGVKWNAVKWIHDTVYDPKSWEEAKAGWAPPTPDPGWCDDFNAGCADWAASGECEKNPGYMIGEGGQPGQCRKVCKACRVCERDDKACLSENRKKAGFGEFDEAEFKFPPGF